MFVSSCWHFDIDHSYRFKWEYGICATARGIHFPERLEFFFRKKLLKLFFVEGNKNEYNFCTMVLRDSDTLSHAF